MSKPVYFDIDWMRRAGLRRFRREVQLYNLLMGHSTHEEMALATEDEAERYFDELKRRVRGLTSRRR